MISAYTHKIDFTICMTWSWKKRPTSYPQLTDIACAQASCMNKQPKKTLWELNHYHKGHLQVPEQCKKADYGVNTSWASGYLGSKARKNRDIKAGHRNTVLLPLLWYACFCTPTLLFFFFPAFLFLRQNTSPVQARNLATCLAHSSL